MDHATLRWQLHTSLLRFRRQRLFHLIDTELTQGELLCLTALHCYQQEHPTEQGIHVWALAEQMHIHRPAASRFLRTLEQHGLVVRSICPEDRRNVSVQMTERGMQLRADAAQQMSQRIDRIIQRMGSENVEQLITQINRLCDVIDQEKEAGTQC